MKPKTTIYLLLLVGCVVLIAVWAWALSAGAVPLGLTFAVAATAILCVVSSAIATKKIRAAHRLSIGDVVSAGRMIAIAPLALGVFVAIWEYVPSRSGGGTHIDRRYALLFFAIAAYLIVFPLLSRRKIR